MYIYIYMLKGERVFACSARQPQIVPGVFPGACSLQMFPEAPSP